MLFDLPRADPRKIHDDVVFAVELQRERSIGCDLGQAVLLVDVRDPLSSMPYGYKHECQCGSVQATIGDREDRDCESERRESKDEGNDQAGNVQKQREHFSKTFQRRLATSLHHPEATRNIADAPPIE